MTINLSKKFTPEFYETYGEEPGFYLTQAAILSGIYEKEIKRPFLSEMRRHRMAEIAKGLNEWYRKAGQEGLLEKYPLDEAVLLLRYSRYAVRRHAFHWMGYDAVMKWLTGHIPVRTGFYDNPLGVPYSDGLPRK